MVSKRSTPKPCFQFGIHSAQSAVRVREEERARDRKERGRKGNFQHLCGSTTLRLHQAIRPLVEAPSYSSKAMRHMLKPQPASISSLQTVQFVYFLSSLYLLLCIEPKDKFYICLKIFLRDTWKQMYYDTHICREDFGKDALMEDWVKKFEKLAGSQQKDCISDAKHPAWYLPTYFSQHILHHKVHKPNMLKSYFGIERYTGKIESCKRVNIVWYTCHNKWYISLIHIYQEVELGQLK